MPGVIQLLSSTAGSWTQAVCLQGSCLAKIISHQKTKLFLLKNTRTKGEKLPGGRFGVYQKLQIHIARAELAGTQEQLSRLDQEVCFCLPASPPCPVVSSLEDIGWLLLILLFQGPLARHSASLKLWSWEEAKEELVLSEHAQGSAIVGREP